MNRNTPSFDVAPTNVDIGRSTFNLDHTHKTSFNVGQIIPHYVQEVLPGDTHSIDTSKVARLQTLLTPIMDNLYLDTYYFFVPNRLVWEHWKQFCGENTASAWIPGTTYQIPKIQAPASTGFITGTIADYMGIPIGVPGLLVNALPIRAYALIMNEWFRDQNLQQPLNIPVTDSTVTGVNTGTFVTDCAKGGLPYIASKYRDYLTSCLPAPQKGPDVGIGLTGNLSVYGTGNALTLSTGSTAYGMVGFKSGGENMYTGLANQPLGTVYSGTAPSSNAVGFPTKASGINSEAYADLSTATSVTINSLRTAFAIQKWYEKLARGGSRYTEIIKSMFEVTSPDSRLQRPEYLGGNRITLNVNQVVQQSMTSGSEPLGELGAYSMTTDYNNDFTKSFTEHGYIIGVMCARYEHTYQQGLERMWSRTDLFDFYWPTFANLGEMAVKNKEVYAQGTSTDDEVFGYQEAWADYRHRQDRISGQLRSTATAPLDVWHLGDKYTTLPSLSDAWIQENKTNVDRVLAVTSSTSNQIFADIYIQNKATRPLPMYSIPGLIDHH